MIASSVAVASANKLSTASVSWDQRVGGFTAVPALIRQLGADPARLLREVGLDPQALDAPDRRVPFSSICEMFEAAATQTGCAHFGLLVGRAWTISDLGLVGEVMRNSSTVGGALRTLTVHQHLNSGGGLSFFLERGRLVDLGYAIYHPGVIAAGQMHDAVMAFGFNLMRELCGEAWTPFEVHISHSRPNDAEPYRRFFRVPLRFDSEICALRFAVDWLKRPIDGADPKKLRMVEMKAQAAGKDVLLQQVFRALRTQILYENFSGDEVAQMLALHRRTLNRRLRALGTTFQDVLDQVRFDVARQLLSNTDLALDDIAAALGYAGISSFMRSFRRWSGTTPSRWRRNAFTGISPASAERESLAI